MLLDGKVHLDPRNSVEPWTLCNFSDGANLSRDVVLISSLLIDLKGRETIIYQRNIAAIRMATQAKLNLEVLALDFARSLLIPEVVIVTVVSVTDMFGSIKETTEGYPVGRDAGGSWLMRPFTSKVVAGAIAMTVTPGPSPPVMVKR